MIENEALANMQLQARVNDLIKIARDHEEKLKVLDALTAMVKEIHVALIGTLDKKGMKTVVMEHEEYIKECKEQTREIRRARFDWWRWAERAVIAAFLTAWVREKFFIGN